MTVIVQGVVASENRLAFHWFDYSNMLLSLTLNLQLPTGKNEEGESISPVWLLQYANIVKLIPIINCTRQRRTREHLTSVAIAMC